MDADQLAAYGSLPLSRSHRLLDFEEADVDIRESDPPQLMLRVRGTAPYPAMRITLEPRIYLQQPDLWGIEVVGVLVEPGSPRPTPYEVRLDLSGPMGIKGIEVVGATRTSQILLAAGDVVGERGRPAALRGVVKDSSGWPLRGVTVVARTPAYEFPRGLAAQTDTEGRYTMQLPGPGRYRVTIEMDGYAGAVGETEVRVGGTARQDFYLTPLEVARFAPTVGRETDQEHGSGTGGPDEASPDDGGVVEGSGDAASPTKSEGSAETRTKRRSPRTRST
jgi:hypothetical protein